MPADLTITFTRGKDGADVMSCTRRDGSKTWSKLHPAFPVHDMTHYSVESTLRARDGFFGLLAQGWNITDFGKPETRGKLPIEAVWVEHVVGVFWREFVSRDISSYEDFTSAIEMSIAALREHVQTTRMQKVLSEPDIERDRRVIDRRITEVEHAAVFSRLGELSAQWAMLRPGDSMELSFELPAAAH